MIADFFSTCKHIEELHFGVERLAHVRSGLSCPSRIDDVHSNLTAVSTPHGQFRVDAMAAGSLGHGLFVIKACGHRE